MSGRAGLTTKVRAGKVRWGTKGARRKLMTAIWGSSRTGIGALASAAVVALTVGLPAQAGQKLYDMDSLLRQSEARLDRLGIPRGSSPPATAGQIPGRAKPRPPMAELERVPVPRRPAPANRPSFISELVVGGWLHAPEEGNNEANTYDFNLEIISRRITLLESGNRFAAFFLSPRLILGGSINNENETHTAYLGVNWAYQFDNGLFASFSFGPTYHTGNLEQERVRCSGVCSSPDNTTPVNTGDVTLGSPILFRESLDVGYRVGAHGVSVFAAHISNAGFDDDNDGLNFVGLRYSFALDHGRRK